MLKCKLTTWQRHDLSYFYSMCSFWAPSDFSLLLVSNWKALITTNAKKAETYQKTNRKKLLYLSIAVPPGYRSDLSETWLQRSLNDASTKLSFLLFHFYQHNLSGDDLQSRQSLAPDTLNNIQFQQIGKDSLLQFNSNQLYLYRAKSQQLLYIVR